MPNLWEHRERVVDFSPIQTRQPCRLGMKWCDMLVLVIAGPAQPAYLRYEHGFIANLRKPCSNSRALT